MRLEQLYKLYKVAPELAVEETFKLYASEFVDVLVTKEEQELLLKSEIIDYFEKIKKNEDVFVDFNEKVFIDSVKKSILKHTDQKIERIYREFGSDIVFEDYVGYSRLVLGKEDSELVDYEALAFTYITPHGTRILVDIKDRIYDSLSDMYVEAYEKQKSGDISEQDVSFMIDVMNEIDSLILKQEFEAALAKTVALQIYMGCGTKFLPTLKRFITGELLISSTLGITDELNKTKGKGGR